MIGFNSVTLRGMISGHLDVNETKNGFKYLEVNVSIEENRMVDGKWTVAETIIPVTFFGETAEEIAGSCRAGDYLIMTGKVRSKMTQTQDGREFPRLSITCTSFEYVGSVRDEAPPASAPQAYAPPAPPQAIPVRSHRPAYSNAAPVPAVDDTPF